MGWAESSLLLVSWCLASHPPAPCLWQAWGATLRELKELPQSQNSPLRQWRKASSSHVHDDSHKRHSQAELQG